MKSPFPGMDPYLEEHWLDVHHSLCTYSRDALQKQIRPALLARVEERLVVESDAWKDQQIFPDVKVVRDPRTADRLPPAATTALLDAPLILQWGNESATEGYINIIDPKTGGKLITVIEFLSPSNKLPGEGQKQYLKKQQELREARVSLVEIDLLRNGDWILQAPFERVPKSHRTTYRACVHRGWKGSEGEIYRMPLEQPLPTINIPLREGDADAKLDLLAVFEQVYENGAYDSTDYTQPPVPPLGKEQAEWAEALLKSSGKR